MRYAPIWKDTYYTTTSTRLHYKIYQNNTLVYEGVAVKMPGELNLNININKICKDYLSQGINTLITTSAQSEQATSAYLAFDLKNENGTILDSYGFLYDWDKGHSWNGAATTLSLPVNGEYADGQMKLKTTVSSSKIVTNYRSTGDYDKAVCADYVLYYLNARGGWDAFAYTGRCIRTDKVQQYTFNHSYNNNNSDEFEVGRYAAEITPQWELNTGILTDGQSAIYAHNLATSNKAYLHILPEGLIIPVVITDNSVTYKENTSKGVVSYKTTVKASQIELKQ